MHEQFAARSFGGGAPSTGEDASLFIHAGGLEVRTARGTQRVNLDAVRIREVVSAQAGIEFSWETRAGRCAAQVFDPQDLRRLQKHPALRTLPPMLAVRGGQRRARVARTALWVAGVALILLPALLVAAFFWQADRIAGVLSGKVPVAQEQALGRQVFASMRGRLQLEDSGAAAEQVRMLGARLTGDSRFNYEFHVARDPAVNAFALPGGIIVVHTGLLEAVRRPEELAGVLAHEVQHVEQRHSLRAMIKELGLRGLWAAATGDIGGSLAGQAAVELASLGFSRDAERDADARGFDTLVKHGIDPRGMVDFFETLGGASGAAPPAWISTHPPSAQRRDALQKRLASLGGQRFEPLPGNAP